MPFREVYSQRVPSWEVLPREVPSQGSAIPGKCHPREVPSQKVHSHEVSSQKVPFQEVPFREVLFQGNVFPGKYCSREMLSHRKASCMQRRKGLDGNCIAKV